MQKSKPKPGLAITTVLAVIGTFVVNSLSNFFPPGGQNVGEIANTLLAGVLITPANYAFIIWGVIYVGLIAYSLYQLQPAQQENSDFSRANKLLIVACVAQIIWIFCFTLKLFSLSILPMLAILLPLLGIYINLGLNQLCQSWQQKWFVKIPFSIYTAWISVATIVNIASALYVAGWNGWGLSDTLWTAIMLIVGGSVAGFIALAYRDVSFVMVFAWAYAAIVVRHPDITIIRVTGIVVILLLFGLLAVGRFYQSRKA
ncbi:MAG: tryptophan-rich sensory protein [Cyanobacteria bacterium P01_H01_bin.15]